MSCRYCFVEKAGVLSTNDYVKVIEKLAKYFTRINFVGGEPTCSSSLLSFVKKSKSLGLDCTMVTNGFELIHNEDKFLELYSL